MNQAEGIIESGRRAAENFDGWNAIIKGHEQAKTELDWPLYETALMLRQECRQHVEAALRGELRDHAMLQRLNADMETIHNEMDAAESA